MSVHSARNTALAEQPGALIDEPPAPAVRTTAATLSQDIAVAQIRPSPTNPRTTFNEEAMAALTASVAGQAIRTYAGAPRLTPICTDPRRYAKLRTEARDTAARQRQETYEAHLLRALSVIKAEPAGDNRALALLVMAALADVDRDILERAAVRQTAGRATPPGPPDRWLPDHERDAGVHAMLDQLAAIDSRDLVRLAADAINTPFPVVCLRGCTPGEAMP